MVAVSGISSIQPYVLEGTVSSISSGIEIWHLFLVYIVVVCGK